MNSQSKKIQNLKENSDAIFQELFGLFGKGEPKKGERGNLNPSGLMYEDDVIKINPDWSVIFKSTGSVVKKPMPGYAAFTNLSWDSDNLKWLISSDFVAGSMQIKDEKVDRFIEGKWYSGPFKGRAFIKSEFGIRDGNKAYFIGGKFIDSIWNPNPHYFIDGTTNESDTILGLKNINTLNQNKFGFNIISVISGKKIVMEMENGVSHEVYILKRLDSKSSTFHYKVKNGHTNEVFSIPIKWSAIRGNSVQEFIDLTTISNQRVPGVFSNLLGLKFDSPIIKVLVTDGTEYGKKSVEVPAQEIPKETPADLSKKQVSFELINVPFLGIDKISRKGGPETSLYFNFPTAQHQNGYNAIVDAASKGWIKAYISEVKSALDNKVINGAPVNFPYLASLIGKDSGADIKAMDQNLVNALSGLESFLKYFVNTLVRRVRKTGAEKGLYDIEDIAGKDLIKSRLRVLLGIEKAPEVTSATPGAPQVAQKGAIGKTFPKAKIAENEQIRCIIRDILSENM